MDETKYHLFKVYDYKGGELSPSINLSKVELIEDILESFIDTDFYYEDEDNTPTKEEIIKHLTNVNNLPEFSIYAGGDGHVADLYYTTPTGDLEGLNKTQFIKDNASDIADIIIANN